MCRLKPRRQQKAIPEWFLHNASKPRHRATSEELRGEWVADTDAEETCLSLCSSFWGMRWVWYMVFEDLAVQLQDPARKSMQSKFLTPRQALLRLPLGTNSARLSSVERSGRPPSPWSLSRPVTTLLVAVGRPATAGEAARPHGLAGRVRLGNRRE